MFYAVQGVNLMAIKQSIWSLDNKEELVPCNNYVESEIENLFFERIEMLDPEWLIIGKQVVTDYGSRIDLLCIDVGGDLIIVELKRGLTPRDVTAQIIDYASWASALTADSIAKIYEEKNNGDTIDAAYFSKFGRTLDTDSINTDTKMVIVATQMDNSTERIIRYLNSFSLDINVLFFQIFEHQDARLLSRVWLIEESEEEVIRARARLTQKLWNGEFYHSFGVDGERDWADAMKYGFISAGGGSWYSGTLYNLELGNRVWVNIPHTRYVGVGEVIDTAQLCKDAFFEINGQDIPFYNIIDLQGEYLKDFEDERAEHLVKVKWQHIVPISEAVHETGFFGNQHIICKPTDGKWVYTIDRLKKVWNIED